MFILRFINDDDDLSVKEFVSLADLKEYINQGTRNYYLSDYIYDLFHDLDEMSKLELVDMLKKEYPRRKKLHEMLDACLKEGDEIEIQY